MLECLLLKEFHDLEFVEGIIFGAKNCKFFDEDELRIGWVNEAEMNLSLPLQELTNHTINLTPSNDMKKVECLWNGVIEDDITSAILVIGCINRTSLLD